MYSDFYGKKDKVSIGAKLFSNKITGVQTDKQINRPKDGQTERIFVIIK